MAHVGKELRLVLVSPLQLDVERGEARGLFSGEMKAARLLDRGSGVLREQGEQLDRVAVERTAVIDRQHAEQLIADDQRKAGERLDAFLRHPGVEANLPVVGGVVGHDRHSQFGNLAEFTHAPLHPSRNWWRVFRRVMAGTPPERTVAGFQQPDLRRGEPQVAGERGGYDIEQLGLEELLVHLVDRLVEQLQAAGAFLTFLEETEVAKRYRQLLREDLERLLLPSGQAALIILGLEVQHAVDLAFE